MRVITDETVRRELTPARALAWIRAALAAEHDGELVAPPRVQAALGSRTLVFTAGELRGHWVGYRSYTSPGSGTDDQLVTVVDTGTGRTRGVYTGTALGPRRVGAIGAVAADLLAPAEVTEVAVVGTGAQAWHQLWALREVRRPGTVRVYSRDPGRRAAFAERVTGELDLTAVASGSAEAAVGGAQLVILATDSAVPVIEAGWLAPGTSVTTLGPKRVHRHEFGLDLLDRAALVVTDSVQQIGAYQPPNLVEAAGPAYVDRLRSLGALLAAGPRPALDPRSAQDVSVFLSVGLAGTEAYLFARLLEVLTPAT